MGEYRHNLDSKNRLIIPAKFRDDLQGPLVVSRGNDGCLNLYRQEQFEEKVQKLGRLPSTNGQVRKYIRALMASADSCSLDNQGRIQLSAAIMTNNRITKNVVVNGVVDHVEIWPEDVWNAYETDANDSFESAGEELTELLMR